MNIKRLIQAMLVWVYRAAQSLSRSQALNEQAAAGMLEIGRHTYGVPLIEQYQGSERKVTIGSFCSIAPRVVIVAGGIHPSDWVSTYPFRINWRMPQAYGDGMPTSKGEVHIGSDVWIGTEVMILSGVTIGHGAIVSARSVVTRDIPPYAIAAGTPARVIRYRFEPEVIKRLLMLEWWKWDDQQIRDAVPLLSSGNVDAFLAQYLRTDA